MQYKSIKKKYINYYYYYYCYCYYYCYHFQFHHEIVVSLLIFFEVLLQMFGSMLQILCHLM